MCAQTCRGHPTDAAEYIPSFRCISRHMCKRMSKHMPVHMPMHFSIYMSARMSTHTVAVNSGSLCLQNADDPHVYTHVISHRAADSAIPRSGLGYTAQRTRLYRAADSAIPRSGLGCVSTTFTEWQGGGCTSRTAAVYGHACRHAHRHTRRHAYGQGILVDMHMDKRQTRT